MQKVIDVFFSKTEQDELGIELTEHREANQVFVRILDAYDKLKTENEKLKKFALKLVEEESELTEKNLDYWAEEYLHAYECLVNPENKEKYRRYDGQK